MRSRSSKSSVNRMRSGINKKENHSLAENDFIRVPIEYDEHHKKVVEQNKQVKELKYEIFDFIRKYIYSNKSTLELINELNSKEEYNQYAEFFQSWISDTIKTKNEVINLIFKEKQKGKTDEEIENKIRASRKYEKISKYISSLIKEQTEKTDEGIEHE